MSLRDAQDAARSAERERASLTAAMSEQNQRLAAELEAAQGREAQAQERLQELRTQVLG